MTEDKTVVKEFVELVERRRVRNKSDTSTEILLEEYVSFEVLCISTQYLALKALVEDSEEYPACANNAQTHKEDTQEEPEKERTLKEIAQNRYSFYKNHFRDPSAHQWFLALSEYLEER